MKIGTHNGVFHADDAFAVAALLVLHPEAEIVRSRDKAALDACDVLVDVGGVYDPATRRYDHHQRPTGAARWPVPARPNGVPRSSFGLVWLHHGEDVARATVPDADATEVASRVDTSLVAGIDATDCGYPLYEGGRPVAPGTSTTSVSRVVSLLNPTWDEEQDHDVSFADAVALAGVILHRAIKAAAAEVAAEAEFRAAEAKTGQVVVLDRYLPWTGLEVAEGKLFVVFQAAGDGTWMVQAVPPRPGSFAQRKPLPAAWAGLRADQLAALTGVQDAVFCHNGRFIAGAGSRSGALRMAELACAE